MTEQELQWLREVLGPSYAWSNAEFRAFAELKQQFASDIPEFARERFLRETTARAFRCSASPGLSAAMYRWYVHNQQPEPFLVLEYELEHIERILNSTVTLERYRDDPHERQRVLEDVYFYQLEQIRRLSPGIPSITSDPLLQPQDDVRLSLSNLAQWVRVAITAIHTENALSDPTPDFAEPTHSPDFTSVRWYGTEYLFSKGNQAESVRVLWEAREAGDHSVSQETIGEAVSPGVNRFELSKVFRRRNAHGRYEAHPAWGTMIQAARKGCYRLAKPESASSRK